jgi:tetratricopeptide (TPR) repeat protein
VAEQLDIFGHWTRVRPEAPAAEATPAAVEAPPPVPARQTQLFEGVHLGHAAMLRALVALAPSALRAAAARVAADFPDYAPAVRWPDWAERLERLLALDAARLSDAALAPVRWEALPPDAAHALRNALLLEAFARLGPTGTTPDGAPAASLLRHAGRPDLAAEALEAALRHDPDDATAHVELALACTAIGRRERALGAWRDALLVDPDAVADDELGDTPFAELLDDAEALGLPGAARGWIPALAALRRIVSLPAWAETCAADAPPPRRAAALVAQLGRARRERAADAVVIDLKRRLGALAPGLRERVRGV